MTATQAAIAKLAVQDNLTGDETTAAMREIMGGEATPAQIGAFLMALRIKGETVDEIAAAAAVMRDFAKRVELDVAPLIDTCGTGGDESELFNVSTAVAFVAAAGGANVAKHGNRSVSSRSGSADVLEAAGVNIELTPDQVAECVRQVGIGFLFAPAHHGAMRHAVGPRKELALRTIFNVLGPLTNPAGAPRQLLGVFDGGRVRTLAEVLRELGSERVMVVHSEDGLDEISPAAPTRVANLENGEISEFTIDPRDYGVEHNDLSPLRVANASESLSRIREALSGVDGVASDIVALNSGAALVVAGLANDLGAGVRQARDIMTSGAAWLKLEELARMSRSL